MEQKEILPVPDPSILTTAQLDKGLLSLRELIEARLQCTKEIVEQMQGKIDQQPAEIDSHIDQLRAFYEEKFRSIATQFNERDIRTDKVADLGQKALDAALAAAKEAVTEQNKSNQLAIAKSEAATTKQIDQQGLLLTNTTGSMAETIADMKTRLTTIEGRGSGLNAGWGYLVGGIGGLVGVATVIILVFKLAQ